MNWTAFGAWGQWAAAIATFAVILYAFWHEHLRRPKLLLSFDSDQDVKSQMFTASLGDVSIRSRWLRIRVKNAPRRRFAKNCRAFLIGIERAGPEATGEDVFKDDVRQLVWMHDELGKPAARDLLPGVAHWVDVVAGIDGQNELSVRAFPPYPIGHGDYIFTVQVSAEDADPKEIKVKVHWEGIWDSLRGEKV